LAFAIDKAKVPLNGMEFKGNLLAEPRKTYFTEMYYIAVMDCEDEVESIVGESGARVRITTFMTAND